MKTIIEILIDNSNSMGRCEGLEHFEQFLLPDGSTRMKLVKKILINEIIPTLDYASKLVVRTFFSGKKGKPIITPIYNF